MIDITESAIAGQSIAGVRLGDKLDKYIQFVGQVLDEHSTPWTNSIAINNEGLLMYKYTNGETTLYFKNSILELTFNSEDTLYMVTASNGFKGEVYEGVKLGDPLASIDHPLYLDETDDVHYLCSEEGEIFPGIYFVADGANIDKYPNQKIKEVCVHNWDMAAP
jgi:hypothetical protein